LGVYEKLVRRRNYPLSAQFGVLRERIRYGVREDELGEEALSLPAPFTTHFFQEQCQAYTVPERFFLDICLSGYFSKPTPFSGLRKSVWFGLNFNPPPPPPFSVIRIWSGSCCALDLNSSDL